MPRDLSLEKKTDVLDSMAPLTREPEGGAPPVTSFGFADGLEHGAQGKYHLAMLDEEEDEDRARRRNELNVFPESLNVGYLEQIAALEYAAFPEEEACTREKFIYRLTAAPELTLGLFTTATAPSPLLSLPTAVHAPITPAVPPSPTSTSARDAKTPADGLPRKQILLAHAVATKTTNSTVTDDDMALPPHWREQSHINPELGHKEAGRTVALHSLAVLPECQRIGLGRVVLRGFVQRMEGSGLVDRVALLSHEHLINFYEGCGFRCLGKSDATFGGGGWYDMIMDLTPNLPPGETSGGRGKRAGTLVERNFSDEMEVQSDKKEREERKQALPPDDGRLAASFG